MERSSTDATLGNAWFNRRRDRAPEKSVAPQRRRSIEALIVEFVLWLTVLAGKSAGRRAARKAVLINRWTQLSGDA
ncbi:MAG: hypothetical protein ACREGD_00770 [Candidatus Saccharimonadales bacterium]